jgi:hypothetical protein
MKLTQQVQWDQWVAEKVDVVMVVRWAVQLAVQLL